MQLFATIGLVALGLGLSMLVREFDLSVAGHEYTHLISNRMVGGPDASLTSAQGGAMGESWSDLDALEFLHESGLAGKQGEEPWSLGALMGPTHRVSWVHRSPK